MYMNISKLRYNAVIEGVCCAEKHNLFKNTLMRLADCTFINRTEKYL